MDEVSELSWAELSWAEWVPIYRHVATSTFLWNIFTCNFPISIMICCFALCRFTMTPPPTNVLIFTVLLPVEMYVRQTIQLPPPPPQPPPPPPFWVVNAMPPLWWDRSNLTHPIPVYVSLISFLMPHVPNCSTSQYLRSICESIWSSNLA